MERAEILRDAGRGGMRPRHGASRAEGRKGKPERAAAALDRHARHVRGVGTAGERRVLSRDDDCLSRRARHRRGGGRAPPQRQGARRGRGDADDAARRQGPGISRGLSRRRRRRAFAAFAPRRGGGCGGRTPPVLRGHDAGEGGTYPHLPGSALLLHRRTGRGTCPGDRPVARSSAKVETALAVFERRGPVAHPQRRSARNS